jgi:nucleotide-binding universal stress UspA family protein
MHADLEALFNWPSETTHSGGLYERAEKAATAASDLDDLRLTQDEEPWKALLRHARAQDADVVAVGARETAGRTLREVLLHAQRSVLAVPLAPRRSDRFD